MKMNEMSDGDALLQLDTYIKVRYYIIFFIRFMLILMHTLCIGLCSSRCIGVHGIKVMVTRNRSLCYELNNNALSFFKLQLN